MKIIPLFLCLVFAVNSFGAPLIYKGKKEINSLDAHIELATVDVSKFKKIRFSLTFEPKSKEKQINGYRVYGIESGEDVLIWGGLVNDGFSITLDVVPNKIKFTAEGRGVYQLYVWGIE